MSTKKRKMLAVAISGLFAFGLFAVLAYSGPALGTPTSLPTLDGNYVVEASGTAYFPYTGNSFFPDIAFAQQVLHFTMAGSAHFKKGKNDSVNLTLNLGGLTTYQGTTFSFDGNDVICYLNTAGDLIYIPGKPATLTVTSNTGDTCMGPSGSQIGILSEVGKVIPFNFYPTLTGGVMVSNYTYVTTTSSPNTPVVGTYPNAFNDAYGDPATDFSAIGRLTGTP